MVITNCKKMDERVQLTESIVNGTIEEMVAAAKSCRTTLANNQRSFSKPEAKIVVDALLQMANHAERAEASLRATLDEVVVFRKMLHEIMEDLQEHLQVRIMALTQGDENVLKAPEVELNDENSHAAILIAGQREDVARQTCTKALKVVRSAKSDLELRRSKMHLAMTHMREQKVRRDSEIRHGNFGSTGQRVTDPSTRKLPTTPETTRG